MLLSVREEIDNAYSQDMELQNKPLEIVSHEKKTLQTSNEQQPCLG